MESDDSEEPRGDQPPLETTSFATVQKPDLADEDDDQVLLYWGRFWGEREDLAVAFCVDMNLDTNDLRESEFLVFEDEERLREFDPDQHFGRFGRLCRQGSSNPDLPNAAIEQVEEGFRKFLDNREQMKRCRRVLKSKDREGFADLTYDLLANLIHKGDITYQVRGELTTAAGLGNGSSRAQSPLDKGTGGTAGVPGGSGPDGEGGETDDEDEEDDEDYLDVSMVTSPMKGKFPHELQVGDDILVRATGKVVEQLPENLQDSKKDGVSVPLQSRVTSLTSQPDLPEDFDGSPEDYWEITVDVLNDHPGRSIVHKDSQIKPVQSDEDEASDSPLAPVYLIAAGLVLIALIVLAYLIFGL